jgi:AraC-like DNA-binding protein
MAGFASFRRMQKAPMAECNSPPKGPPYTRLYNASPSELSYLSWGRRRYGDRPVRESAHEGWHYFVVLAGHPHLMIQGRRYLTEPGFVCVAQPDCPVGHSDEPGGECQMLTWIWRTPPNHSLVRPAKGAFLFLPVDRAVLPQLRRIHARCREAVTRANEDGILQLRAKRIELDLCLAGGSDRKSPADGQLRFDLAVEYFRNHLPEPEPIRRLTEYLQVSESSLKRLFHSRTGMTPHAFVTDWRMRWARERLEEGGKSVKSIAYSLGYKHANDFSRAFKRYHRETARGVLLGVKRAG